ncbi:MAG: MarR family transcriptional regulator [Clostridia bacterium]|nr:MarR family transcriptional regulator [Clostridia bacterium]
MCDFVVNVNDFLVNTFRSILKVEEKVLKNEKCKNLSISELHLIEAIGKKSAMTVTQIAEKLSITLPSVTAAINKLRLKGYVKKERSEEDRRTVWVTLTEAGKEVELVHEKFHNELVASIANSFDETEKENLLDIVKKLDSFFKITLDKGCES